MSEDPGYWAAPEERGWDEVGPEKAVPDVPGVWPWFIVYCVLMAFMGLVLVGLGILILVIGDKLENAGKDDIPPAIVGAVYGVMGVPFLVFYGAAPFLPKRPWAWVYDLIAICLGLTSCACWAAAIPLLIFWLKPETKAYFHKS